MRAYREGTLEQYLKDSSCGVKGCAEPKHRYEADYCAKHSKQLKRRGRIIIHEVFDSCQWCQVESTTKFCSDSCSGKYWRMKNKEAALANSAARRARKKGAEGSHTNAEWQELVAACEGRCLRCKEIKKLSRDHVVPLSKGGSDYISNIQPLCLSCNARKADKEVDYRT